MLKKNWLILISLLSSILLAYGIEPSENETSNFINQTPLEGKNSFEVNDNMNVKNISTQDSSEDIQSETYYSNLFFNLFMASVTLAGFISIFLVFRYQTIDTYVDNRKPVIRELLKSEIGMCLASQGCLQHL